MAYYTRTIPAGQSDNIKVGTTDKVQCFSSSLPIFEMEVEGFREICAKSMGMERLGEPFNVVTIHNTDQANELTVVIIATYTDKGHFKVTDNRSSESDSLSIFGEVGTSGQPLTRHGGSITDVGESVDYRNVVNLTAGWVYQTIVADTANVNGLNVNLARITPVSMNAGGFGVIFARKGASSNDRTLARISSNDLKPQNARDWKLPPDYSLEVGALNADLIYDACFDIL